MSSGTNVFVKHFWPATYFNTVTISIVVIRNKTPDRGMKTSPIANQKFAQVCVWSPCSLQCLSSLVKNDMGMSRKMTLSWLTLLCLTGSLSHVRSTIAGNHASDETVQRSTASSTPPLFPQQVLRSYEAVYLACCRGDAHFRDQQGRAVTVSDCTNFANRLMCLECWKY